MEVRRQRRCDAQHHLAPAAPAACTAAARAGRQTRGPSSHLRLRQCRVAADKGNEAFWQHEWECHGVCAGVEDGALSTEQGFFDSVLQLDQLYPLAVCPLSLPWHL